MCGSRCGSSTTTPCSSAAARSRSRLADELGRPRCPKMRDCDARREARLRVQGAVTRERERLRVTECPPPSPPRRPTPSPRPTPQGGGRAGNSRGAKIGLQPGSQQARHVTVATTAGPARDGCHRPTVATARQQSKAGATLLPPCSCTPPRRRARRDIITKRQGGREERQGMGVGQHGRGVPGPLAFPRLEVEHLEGALQEVELDAPVQLGRRAVTRGAVHLDHVPGAWHATHTHTRVRASGLGATPSCLRIRAAGTRSARSAGGSLGGACVCGGLAGWGVRVRRARWVGRACACARVCVCVQGSVRRGTGQVCFIQGDGF